jgi:hypothetical protein
VARHLRFDLLFHVFVSHFVLPFRGEIKWCQGRPLWAFATEGGRARRGPQASA